MNRRASKALALILLACVATSIEVAHVRAQPIGGAGRYVRIEGGAVIDEATVRTARETVTHSMETPVWTNPAGFENDVFTFTRVVFRSDPSQAGGEWDFQRRLGWWVDYPDADLNLSYRLQQLTTIRTDPDCRVVRLTDPELFNHPLLYLEHTGYMVLSDTEIRNLRRYFASGGAMFVNDFWNSREWDGFAAQIRRVLPGADWVELDTEHPVFHCIYDLRGPMHGMRVPTMQFWNETFDPLDPLSEPHRIYRGEGSETMHVRALHDEEGHMLILAIHNSDVSDGWEREAEDNRYFDRFSEKIAYPLAINIIFHLMTD